MAITDYHSMVLAHELQNRSTPSGISKIANTIAGAKVDLNPHQIDAALFAFENPLSQGVLLADEVGLGKTIEAGLIIAQLWAERERNILIITPANLRKQWQSELSDKFFLEGEILERKSYNQRLRDGISNPFDSNKIVICSYQFASSQSAHLRRIDWDLIVMDEAHFLRNVYKSSGSKIAKNLQQALAGRRKLLLTATPLQNSLNELFGLVSMIDENVFGDLKSFAAQYTRLSKNGAFTELKERLRPIAHRTLRRQVTAYVRYTDRHAIVQPFEPSDDEMRLYDLVSEYLRSDHLHALPPSQRTLMTLVLRKLLASSTFAIAGTLEHIANRLEGEAVDADNLLAQLSTEFESLDDAVDEAEPSQNLPTPLSSSQTIHDEIRSLRKFVQLARSIPVNAKGQALLVALATAFSRATDVGAPRKAIIFTESRRTQLYLLELLRGTDSFSEGIVLFNGTNNDPTSREIYQRWIAQHRGTEVVTGSAEVDTRSALVEYFRDEGQIMIATEAAAQGLNLQFCSLIVNYDLPWNPQRIEQRIGRCHRYGQKHDVVVVNFLNTRNKADERVYELLDEKFHLFKGVFGASDDVLGSITSGYDIEREINRIYQECRRPAEIDAAFAELRGRLDVEIQSQMEDTRRLLIEHFDEEVTERLAGVKSQTLSAHSRVDRTLMKVTLHELGDHAKRLSDSSFTLWTNPFHDRRIRPGRYELPRVTSVPEHYYRLGDPLSEHVVQKALSRQLRTAEIVFDYSQYPGRITAIERLKGHSGWLTMSLLRLKGARAKDEFLVASAVTDDGDSVDAAAALRFFDFDGYVCGLVDPSSAPVALLANLSSSIQSEIAEQTRERNVVFLEGEADKLDQWAADKRRSLDEEISEIEARISEVRKRIRTTRLVSERMDARREINSLESDKDIKLNEREQQRREITRLRDEKLDEIEDMLYQESSQESLFTIRWTIA